MPATTPSPRVLSVVTAADGSDPELLARAAASLAAQRLPAGWALEWVLALDRAPEAVPDLPLEPVVVRTHPRAQGVAAARTLAAVRATGELLYVLDADDEVPAGGLAALVGALLEEPEAAYAVSCSWHVVDRDGVLLEERTTPLPPGLLKAGEVRSFRRLHGRCPFPPAQLLVRADALWQAGGWPALAIEEDTALLLALDAVRPGVLVEGVHLRSRRHAAQGTADLAGLSTSFDAAEDWLQRRGLS